jgi:glutamine cyclotransferase
MNRSASGHQREKLPQEVDAYFAELKRIHPPDDLMSTVVTEIEGIGPLGRFSWLPATGLAAAAVLLIAAYVTSSVLPSMRDLPGRAPSATATTSQESSSPQPTPIALDPPSRETLPLAGSVEAELELGVEAYPAAFGHGSLWLSSDPAGTLYRLDPDSGSIVAQIDISGPIADSYNMAPTTDDRWVWVSSGEDRSIVKIDPRTNEIVDRYGVDALGYGMVSTGSDVWMTDHDGDTVVHLDAETGESFKHHFSRPSGVAVTDHGVWVSLLLDRRLLLLDPETVEIIDAYRIGANSVALAAAGDSIWVMRNNGRRVDRFSLTERRVIAQTTEMAVAFVDGESWGITTAGELVKLDPETLAWTAVRDIGNGACECSSLVAGDGRLYVGTGAGRLTVVRP